jgi:arylsulfatase A-like enzyme
MHAMRVLVPAAFAAGLIVVFEIGRTLTVGATHLGAGAGGFALAVAGLLGLALFALGTLTLMGVAFTRAGWRWGQGAQALASGARRVAWALFALLALAVLVFAVQRSTMLFVKWFRRPVYQGLASGLVAAGVVVALAAIAGPIVGLFDRITHRLSNLLPKAIDPTTLRGAATWIALLAIAGAFLAPWLLSELHTVDLRPARLALAWVGVLALAQWWFNARPPRRAAWLGTLALVAVFGAGFGWSAAQLGASQRRVIAVERDTLLTGPLAARLTRLGDGDGDGVSSWFGGADCDDADPKVRPGVYDPADDGVDQNCTGADLVRSADPLRPPPSRPAPGAKQPWHVVLLTIDALRDDTARAFMPNLQAIAAEGTDFTHAYSHGAATYWSLPALLQSTVPSRLRMGRDQTPVNSELLLTEVLRDAGWHTGLFANVTIFFVRGLRQGAQTANYDTSGFTVHGAKPGSAHLTDGLLAHVDQFKQRRLRPQREQFFVWGHYYDPHDPYFEVPEYPAEDGSDRARYEAIVRYTDAQVGRLVEGLKARGVWDRTVFIVTADHGDEFGDHGHRFHGATLYDEMVHVPLIVRVPGVAPRVIGNPIGHAEVAPTLLDLLGVAIPPRFTGRSRAVEVRGGTQPVEPVYFEVFPDSNYAGHQVGVRVGDLKLIHRVHSHAFELYDVAADPGEHDNVVDSHPRAAELRALLGVYLDHHLYALAQGRTGAKLPPGTPKKGKKAKKAKRRAPKKPRRPKKPRVLEPLAPGVHAPASGVKPAAPASKPAPKPAAAPASAGG